MLKSQYLIFWYVILFGKKGDGTAIIEIETGFTPPEHALDTVDYYAARIVSKIARYSKYCG